MSSPKRIVSWNVNGIRACSKSEGWKDVWDLDFDVLALQEIKAFPEQLDFWLREPRGYKSIWFPAEKPGYSGLAVYTKFEPKSIKYGLGIPEYDREGRVLTVDFGDFTLVNTYFPNSQRDHARLPYKLSFCRALEEYLLGLKIEGKNLVICGDYNIAHEDIDLRNPKSNVKTAGFLPEERSWLSHFLAQGFNDVFRDRVTEPHHYTWWSYRPGVREKNIGWRIDYFLTTSSYVGSIDDVRHFPQIIGSDHCPVVLDLKK